MIEIDPKAFDVGRILLQTPYDIKPGIQCQEYSQSMIVRLWRSLLSKTCFCYYYLCCRLAQELAAVGADCIVKTLEDLPRRKKEAIVQDDAQACKAPKVMFKDGLISFDDSATDIFHVRILTLDTRSIA